ncbi:MAG: type II toxin-antitoxin system VapC family toxin [Phycisphaeraceae bacterium]
MRSVPPENEVYLSVVSVWEATIKHSLGKLPLPESPALFFPAQRAMHRIASLPLHEQATTRLASLAPLHNDPFDRMLVCQAIDHGLTIATVDPKIQEYAVAVFR